MFISTGVNLLNAPIASSGGGIPDVYTTGLKVWADFGQTNSYPGSGTSVYDISGNSYTGSLSGGSFTGSFGGGFYMSATANCVRFNSNVFSSAANNTIVVIGNYAPVAGFSRIIGNTRTGGTGDFMADTGAPTRAKIIGSGGSQGFTLSLPTPPQTFFQNELKMYTFQYANSSPWSRNVWVNDTLVFSDTLSGAARNADAGITWGATGTSTFSEGVTGISYVMLAYTGSLDQTAVTKNYNAYKTRYGI